jgi:hydroxylaminobenzene mutase
MDLKNMLARQGHRLIEGGVALFLFTSIWGFVISSVAAPRLGLSVHTLSALQGVMFVALGLAWPRLRLGAAASRTAFSLLIYSAIAILAAFVLASVWGAGNETMPIAAGPAHGSPFEEGAIRWIAYSSAPAGIASFALILWGLRLRP